MKTQFFLCGIALMGTAGAHAQGTRFDPDAPLPTASLMVERPDYATATWMPAAQGNFAALHRPAPDAPIDMIVMHDIEGTAAAAISWFQNPAARVSSHYVVDNKARVWQMVRERDVAWHAGNSAINRRSVGIEMEGYAYRPGFYADALYEASARLVRDISTRHNIARDRTHIIGHHEVPHPRREGVFGGGNGHTDPGPYWDWDRFLELVRNDAQLVSSNFPAALHPGEIARVDATFLNRGDDDWTAFTSARQDTERAKRHPVYLAACLSPQEGQIAPATWRRSAFFHLKSWISPTLASGPAPIDPATGQPKPEEKPDARPNSAQAPTLPGQTARFSFQLQAPLTAGEFTEDFRLVKVGMAPRSPVFFGEPLRVRLTVNPWDIEKPVTDAGWNADGWESKELDGEKLLWRRSVATSPAASNEQSSKAGAAQWQGELPVAGAWDVYVRWPQGTNRTRNATFLVATKNCMQAVRVDQSQEGGAWRKLGRFQLDKKVNVSLQARGDRGVVVAQSLRFVGPF